MTETTLIRKILVANRGEIAVRIIRACRELGGIQTVAVYSDADREALHVRYAEEAYNIGAPAPRESYLNIGKLIDVARHSGADAVHPGYGFLSERAEFAEAVIDAGLTWIGPSPDAIERMGDKLAARELMEKAGVPIVPGTPPGLNDGALMYEAGKIGYPLMVKAAAGGGGKGMRVVWDEHDLPEDLDAARREALNAFGDERLLIEKYLPKAHHIEFQVFGDQHGRLVHLFERECSVQRRHQKIIEETPSPIITPALRERMGAAALAAAGAVGYANAGTVEFILDPDSLNFYFLEMNTRLQVEHPITELVTGLDLVHWQLRVAAGEPFPYQQDQLSQRGHAIECRLYAEDPASGFLPSTGELLQFSLPRGPGIRLDSGVTSGSQVGHFYDPLLAKLIVQAEDRPAAIRRMQAALRESAIHGVTSNLDFLQDVLSHPDFQAGNVTTSWVERTFETWSEPEVAPEALLAAALADLLPAVASTNGSQPEGTAPDPFSPWVAADGFRLGGE
jgi:3-methylcrotonyl-CoA carboxylase alpha subunit